MEYANGGSVYDILKLRGNQGLDLKYIAILMREVLLGIHYLHTQKKIHRDIKSKLHIPINPP